MEKDKNGAFGWLLSQSGERKREFVLSVILAALITVPLGAVCYALMMFGYEENYKRTVNATKALNAVTTEYMRNRGGGKAVRLTSKTDISNRW